MFNIPNVKPDIDIEFEGSINLLLESIAMEEISLSKLMEAEAKKILFALNEYEKNQANMKDILDINKSTNKVMINIIKMQMLLHFKSENVIKLIPSTTTSTTTSTSTSTTTSTSMSTTTSTSMSTTTSTSTSTTTSTSTSTTTSTSTSTTTSTRSHTTTSTTSTCSTTTNCQRCRCSHIGIPCSIATTRQKCRYSLMEKSKDDARNQLDEFCCKTATTSSFSTKTNCQKCRFSIMGTSNGVVLNQSDEFYRQTATLNAFLPVCKCKDNNIRYHVGNDFNSLQMTANVDNIEIDHFPSTYPDRIIISGRGKLRGVANKIFFVLQIWHKKNGKNGFQMTIKDYKNSNFYHYSGFVETPCSSTGIHVKDTFIKRRIRYD